VWDAQTGAALVELKGFNESVTSVSFNRDGTRVVTGEGDSDISRGGAKLWDARTGAVVLDLSVEGPERTGQLGRKGASAASG
jgi:WD40 repeat protein